LGVHIGVYQP